MTPKDAILFKIVHTCAKECLILKYKYIQNPWYNWLDHPVETCLAPSMILGAVILEGKKDEISVKKLLEWPTLLIFAADQNR